MVRQPGERQGLSGENKEREKGVSETIGHKKGRLAWKPHSCHALRPAAVWSSGVVLVQGDEMSSVSFSWVTRV